MFETTKKLSLTVNLASIDSESLAPLAPALCQGVLSPPALFQVTPAAKGTSILVLFGSCGLGLESILGKRMFTPGVSHGRLSIFTDFSAACSRSGKGRVSVPSTILLFLERAMSRLPNRNRTFRCDVPVKANIVGME